MREAHRQHGKLIALALVLASCAGSNPPPAEPQPAPAASTAAPAPAPPPPPPPPRSKSDEALAKMAEFKDEMCACKDSPCAQRVADHMTKWAQEQMSGTSEPPKMTDEQTQRATKIGEQLGECMQTSMGGPPPTSP
jgi:hypothetical protein